MRATGKVLLALLAVGPDGPLFFVPATLADERAKDNFANTARLICIAHAATTAVRQNGCFALLNMTCL